MGMIPVLRFFWHLFAMTNCQSKSEGSSHKNKQNDIHKENRLAKKGIPFAGCSKANIYY